MPIPHQAKITPTPEQTAIVQAAPSGHNLMVSALAGTGKTTTLKMIALAYPNRRGLYLTYNTALKTEAQAKFPPYIHCKTIHGLAYQHVGAKYKGQLNHKLHHSDLIELLAIRPFTHGKFLASSSLIASSAIDMVRIFCYTADVELGPPHYSRRCIEKLMVKYERDNLDFDLENINTPQTFLEKFIVLSCWYAKRLWQAMIDENNHTIPATHDTYLKLYQLSKPTIDNYDYIMLDEAQDANPAILDILSQQTIQRIYVGDKNQQIYGFRGTKNALETIKADTYYLTQSFRFGSAIADEANKDPSKVSRNPQNQRV